MNQNVDDLIKSSILAVVKLKLDKPLRELTYEIYCDFYGCTMTVLR